MNTSNLACPAIQAEAATESNWTVNDILRKFGPAYLKKYREKMSLDQIRTLEALSRCRGPNAGSILYRCRDCLKWHEVPKSCGNRHCPTCQGHKARHWLQEQQARLLPCDYFFVTFTMPKEFRAFARSHPRACYRALMQSAYQSMVTLAKDPKHLGSGKLGMTGVLHTWGRDLNYHPHVHFLVPGGALSPSGTEWLPSPSNFFLPVKALSKIYRAIFREQMRKEGLLEKYDGDPSVWDQPWNVNCQAVGNGREALRYLAPYVYRVAIGNHRIQRVECYDDGSAKVTMMVKPSKSRSYRPMRLDAEKFIRRFLQHVLPKGFQKVRHFGFMHKRSKVSTRWLAMLVTVTLNMVYVLNPTPQELPPRTPLCCPECGGELERIAILPASIGSPAFDPFSANNGSDTS